MSDADKRYPDAASTLARIRSELGKLPAATLQDIQKQFTRFQETSGGAMHQCHSVDQMCRMLADWLDREKRYFDETFSHFAISTPWDEINLKAMAAFGSDPKQHLAVQVHHRGVNYCAIFRYENRRFGIFRSSGYYLLANIRPDRHKDQNHYNSLGIRCQNAGDHAAALTHFSKGFAFGNCPKKIQAEIKDRMATCCAALGRNAEAIRFWQESLQSGHWDSSEREQIQRDIDRVKSSWR